MEERNKDGKFELEPGDNPLLSDKNGKKGKNDIDGSLYELLSVNREGKAPESRHMMRARRTAFNTIKTEEPETAGIKPEARLYEPTENNTGKEKSTKIPDRNGNGHRVVSGRMNRAVKMKDVFGGAEYADDTDAGGGENAQEAVQSGKRKISHGFKEKPAFLTVQAKKILKNKWKFRREPKKKSAEQAENIELSQPLMLTVSPSPHIKHHENTRVLMMDMIVALLPALIWAVFIFGWRALTLTLISVLSCVLSEALTQVLFRRSVTVSDLSAVITGILLAMNLPVTVPLWIPVIGAFFAIVIVKQLFGGIGKNIVNPALAARVFLFSSWPTLMTSFSEPFSSVSAFKIEPDTFDAISGATSLSSLKQGLLPDISIADLFFGNCPGVIGEVSALLLLGGGLYLLIRKTITWHIPVAFIGTVAILTYFFPQTAISSDMIVLKYVVYEIFSGGLLLGAIYMATDYATSPVTGKGQIIYGIGCGAITVFIRYFGAYPEGVSFAILIMNLLVFYIDKFTKPRMFGGVKIER